MGQLSWKDLLRRVRKDFKVRTLTYNGREVEVVLYENKDDHSFVPIGLIVDTELQSQLEFSTADHLTPVEGDQDNPLLEYCLKWRSFKVINPGMGEQRSHVLIHAYINKESLNVTPLVILPDYKMRETICEQN